MLAYDETKAKELWAKADAISPWDGINDQGEAKEFWTKKMNFVVKGEYPMGPNMTWLEVGPSEDEFTTFVLYNKSLMEKQNPNTYTGHPSILLPNRPGKKRVLMVMARPDGPVAP